MVVASSSVMSNDRLKIDLFTGFSGKTCFLMEAFHVWGSKESQCNQNAHATTSWNSKFVGFTDKNISKTSENGGLNYLEITSLVYSSNIPLYLP
jgi:hypothetical protein